MIFQDTQLNLPIFINDETTYLQYFFVTIEYENKHINNNNNLLTYEKTLQTQVLV